MKTAEEKELIEQKKLIAEFVGYPTVTLAGRVSDELTKLLYNDWNSLMSVVEYIESKGYDFSIDNCYARIWDGGESDFELEFSEKTKFKTVFTAILGFIEWYNSEKTTFARHVLAFLKDNCTMVKPIETEEYINSMMEKNICIKYDGIDYYMRKDYVYTKREQKIFDYLSDIQYQQK